MQRARSGAEPDVALELVPSGRALPGDADLVLLPGSKATIADLQALRDAGWDIDIEAHLRRGGHLLGLCGGYQMLGRTIADPLGLEGEAGTSLGLGVLAVDTTLEAGKQLRNVSGHLSLLGRPAMTGYEIHLGVSRGEDLARGAVELSDGRVDGAISADDQVFATYCHGLFDHPEALTALLAWAGMTESAPVDFAARREADLDRLADAVEAALDWQKMAALLPLQASL